MKPAPFKYLAPTSRQEALDALRRYGADAKVLAGGQSLVPLLAMRLARPSILIDLNRVADLAFVKVARTSVTIGAMTRQYAAEFDPRLAARLPLLCDALRWVGHPQIRTRGTIGGSLAHADPSAELPAVMAAFGARVVLQSARGERVVDAARFFTGYLATVLEADELLAEVRIPAQPPGTAWAFREVARRHGDFALVGVAALLQFDDGRRCTSARLIFTGVGPRPVRVPEVEQHLIGRSLTASVTDEAARIVEHALDPDSDIH
ncbi:MAG: xanthine dehydrogenase family protein subunit M, partial [Gemmatimonadetes bacterium]|nr:xanthine dehydrogenase family protein subunit M [Gemmatimonadota bacterium]